MISAREFLLKGNGYKPVVIVNGILLSHLATNIKVSRVKKTTKKTAIRIKKNEKPMYLKDDLYRVHIIFSPRDGIFLAKQNEEESDELASMKATKLEFDGQIIIIYTKSTSYYGVIKRHLLKKDKHNDVIVLSIDFDWMKNDLMKNINKNKKKPMFDEEILDAVKDDNTVSKVIKYYNDGDYKVALCELSNVLEPNRKKYEKLFQNGDETLKIDTFFNFVNNYGIRHWKNKKENGKTIEQKEPTDEQLKVYLDFGLSIYRLFNIYQSENEK